MVNLESIFGDVVIRPEQEIVDILASSRGFRIEKVISPESDVPSKTYDQEEEEFAMVVRGYAELEFEEAGRIERKEMRDGNYLTIPAHLRHRVIKTKEGTLWLAVFYTK